MRNLTSAGAATSARATVENRLAPAVTQIMRRFLAHTQQAALGALDAPVLLAAGRIPFNLNAVGSLWQTAAEELVTEISRAVGTPRKKVLTRYERTVLGRLAGSPISMDAYQSVRDVLTTSVEQAWTRARTERTLRDTLAPDTGVFVRTSDGLVQSGRTWAATADGIARTEATAAFGNSTLNDLYEAGATRAKWVTRHDRKVRDTHAAADGQTVALGEGFLVGGYLLSFPGDPAGPPAETYSCRCVLVDGS